MVETEVSQTHIQLLDESMNKLYSRFLCTEDCSVLKTEDCYVLRIVMY